KFQVTGLSTSGNAATVILVDGKAAGSPIFSRVRDINVDLGRGQDFLRIYGLPTAPPKRDVRNININMGASSGDVVEINPNPAQPQQALDHRLRVKNITIVGSHKRDGMLDYTARVRNVDGEYTVT